MAEPSIRNLKDAPSPESPSRRYSHFLATRKSPSISASGSGSPGSPVRSSPASGNSPGSAESSPHPIRRLLSLPLSPVLHPASEPPRRAASLEEDESASKPLSVTFKEDVRFAQEWESEIVSGEGSDEGDVAASEDVEGDDFDLSEEELEFDFDAASEDDEENKSFRNRVIMWFRAYVPEWIRSPPGWSRIAGVFVRFAPCFCVPCVRRLDTNATDRAILLRLNFLSAFFAAVQIFSGLMVFLIVETDLFVDRTVQVDDGISREETGRSFLPNLWHINGTVMFAGILGIVTLTITILARPVIQQVNLVGSLRYLWFLLWIIPLELYCAIGMFDYHRVTTVWVKHWWGTSSMAWFRDRYCAYGTAGTKCVVPQGGGLLFDNETIWCENFFNATDCTAIRNEAQDDTERFCLGFYYVNAILVLLFIFILWLCVKILEEIITKPIVQSSRESNVPAWLTLPILGCTIVGAVLLFAPSSGVGEEAGSDTVWIGAVYFCTGVLFFFAAVLGWAISNFSILNNRDKRNKSLGILMFIAVMMTTLVAVTTLIIASIVLSVGLVDDPISDSERGKIACQIDTANSCTLCGNRVGKRECPEWTEEDVSKILRTQLKQAATLAIIFWFYAAAALRFGIQLRKHISMYQIDYV